MKKYHCMRINNNNKNDSLFCSIHFFLTKGILEINVNGIKLQGGTS